MPDSSKRRRIITWVALDGAAIGLLLAIASFVLLDSAMIGVFSLVPTVILFSVFLFLSRSEEPEEQPSPAPAAVQVESGLPVHPATGLDRWWVFRQRADEEIARAQRQERILAIVLLESGDLIDTPSDEARSNAANVLRRTIRDGDIPAQFDDTRFVVMLPETDATGAKTAANRLLSGLRSAQDPPLRWRAALVVYPKHGSTPDELLNQAQSVLQPGRLESANRGS